MFKKFINRVFYSFYLIERNIPGLPKGKENGYSESKMYNLLINLEIIIFFVLSGLLAVMLIRTHSIPVLRPVIVILYIMCLYFVHKKLSDDIIKDYEEYYAQFEKDPFSKKLLWVIISCLFYFIIFWTMAASMIIFIYIGSMAY